MSLGKKVTLNTGASLPQLGFGTWQSAPGEVGEAVYEALKAGYRHLDFATIYENQREIAAGMKRAFADIPGLKREDLFILILDKTSKLWNSQHHPDDVEPALDACLEEIGIEYLDLYLVHWPIAFKRGANYFPLIQGSTVEGGDVEIDDDLSIVDTWKAMIKLPKSKTRAVGVSNHSIEHIEALINATGVVPAVNQVERHPLVPNLPLVNYCKEKGIHITAYSAFGNNAFGEPLIINRPEVKAIAEQVSQRTGSPVSAAQVILAWSQVGGHSVIPKSVTPSRIRANFEEIELLPTEVEAVSALGAHPRRFNVPYIANKPRWDINIFNDPAEAPATHKIIF
ncbi:hypothetical protein ASPZODRAFT_168775 [Penicilliopsis zonata CBS 506.65]|uniref:D-xylose reductase [NAD(P)H] n=1 Tax=Penicilliopsis zonata CBS 506.65 TaxID=1073090 RepID=A0A1L9S9X7_9EURO|nr:hypothetical protein ASPZODRAFT_168775 [Penicilliopsis zonata CBS 506.65]OJJ43931.1 hypothetical protein ASPZODRAFT_168775 [Penicilliopsis zonata CBS 506.65]